MTGEPHVRAVPGWVARPLAEVAWMEHSLLWCYVERGKSPEVHGARCALAWIGGVFPEAPATADVAAPTEFRGCAELIICTAVSRGDPYPESAWWHRGGLQQFDTEARRRWWRAWAGYGWTRSIAEGAGTALGWALDATSERVPVLPRHLEDGSRAPAEVRAECAQAIDEALRRPLPHSAPRPLVAGQ